MVYHHFPHSICHEFRYPPCIPYFCAQIHIYIYISTSYTYMCVHMYIYISISISIYIYNVYIYISKHSKTCQTPNITPHCQRANDGIGPELSMAGWFFNRHVYAAAASWTSAPWPKPPDHPVTRSPGHLRSIFGSQKHQKMGFNYHYFKLRWSKKNRIGIFKSSVSIQFS